MFEEASRRHDVLARVQRPQQPLQGRRHARTCIHAIVAIAVVVAGTFVAAHATQDTPTVRRKSFQAVPSVAGRDNFTAYCASCHGNDGKGNGPVAAALKMPVPDLTTIARRAGRFDAVAIERVIAGDDRMPAAHGSMDMPVWGPIFKSVGSNSTATLRLRNLVKHVQSMQVNAT